MSAKTVFLADKELSDWFRSIVNDNRFEKSLAYADSMFMAVPNIEKVSPYEAIRRFKKILMDLPETGTIPTGHYPQSGLHHDLDIRRRTKKPAKEKETTDAPKNT
jgi:hypothetical protein